MEKLDEIFAKYVSEEVVSEEAKKEISTVFEAMVNEKSEAVIEERMKTLVAEAEEHFNKAVEQNKEEMMENVDKYMDSTVNEFIEKNKVAIKNTIVVEKAKAIIDGVQKVFEENGISLPETNTDIVSEMNEKIDTLNTRVDSLVSENYELKHDNEELQKALIFVRETNDMSLVNKEKLMNMMKGLVVESVNDFAEKLNIVKSNLVSEKKASVKEQDDEDIEDKVDEVEDVKDSEDEKESEESCGKKKSVKEWMEKISAMRM